MKLRIRVVPLLVGLASTVLFVGCPVDGPVPGDTKTIMLPGNVPLEMAWCPAGTFMMGQLPFEQDAYYWEGPRHEVTFSSGYWLGKYEVTQAQWTAVMGTTPWLGKPWGVLNSPDCPAVCLSWDDAKAFVSALNSHLLNEEQEPATMRLPTEAEWEYSCRAGTSTRFYWGNDTQSTEIDRYAWCWENSRNVGQDYAHAVGLKRPNMWGLYDMSGNVNEWCEDDMHYDYTGAPSDGSAWVDSPRGPYRVFRGGCWAYDAPHCRSAARDNGVGTTPCIGFRLCMQSPPN